MKKSSIIFSGLSVLFAYGCGNTSSRSDTQEYEVEVRICSNTENDGHCAAELTKVKDIFNGSGKTIYIGEIDEGSTELFLTRKVTKIKPNSGHLQIVISAADGEELGSSEKVTKDELNNVVTRKITMKNALDAGSYTLGLKKYGEDESKGFSQDGYGFVVGKDK